VSNHGINRDIMSCMTATHKATLRDLYSVKGKAELINGEIVQSSSEEAISQTPLTQFRDGPSQSTTSFLNQLVRPVYRRK